MEEMMFMTLAGYIDYLQKPAFGRAKFKKLWFMFDENTCSLNYYTDSNANTLQPLAKIDMTNATVSPCGETDCANEFVINCGDGKTHRFKVADWKEASDWIRKLGQKREGWCKSAVKKQSNKLLQMRPRTLGGMKPYDTSIKPRSASLTSRSPPSENKTGLIDTQINDDEMSTSASSAVKQIFMGTLQKEKRGLLFETESGDASTNVVRSKSVEPQQTDQIDGDDDVPPKPPRRGPSLTSKSPSVPNMLDIANNSDEQIDEPIFDDGFLPEIPSEQVNYKRRMLKLEEKLTTAQKGITVQTRRNIEVKKELQKSKEEVEVLRIEVAELSKYKELSKLPETQLRTNVIELQDLVRSYDEQKKLLLDDLKLRMNQHQDYERAIQEEQRKFVELEQELLKFKAKYVKLLGNSIKINTNYAEPLFVDPEEEKAKFDLLEILKSEAENFSFDGKTFEDQYGDLHDWAACNEVQHYLCHNLYLHFTAAEREKNEKAWDDFMKSAKKSSEVFDKPDRDFRSLLRCGIPFNLRSKLWTMLVDRQMGRTRELKNQSAQPKGYYQSLLGRVTNGVDEKQIMLDLDRTLPHNKYFRKDIGGFGSTYMKNILLAFSVHNPNLGYCQGLNMLVAVGLLFLDEETAFWLLVMIVEKMTPRDYYTPGLLGAQADQVLMRELVADKLPNLSNHLQACNVDISLITFNWFLAAFVDASPTQSMLRIWDCFLYEGRKVLYRCALGILKLYERNILQMLDTNAIMSYLKKLPKHIFDMDGVFNEAFVTFEPFPSRKELLKRHENHMQNVKARYDEEEKVRAAIHAESQKKESLSKRRLIKTRTLSSNLLSEAVTAPRKPVIWECGCAITDDEVWLGCGERQGAKVCVIKCEGEKLNLDVPHLDFPSRLCCMKTVRKDMVVLGTLDFTIHAVNSTTKEEVWSVKVKDSVLDVVASEDDVNLFAGLADGTVAIIQANSYDPPPSSPLLIRIGMESVNCMVLTPDHELWCGSGSSISIISGKTMEPLKSLSGAERKSLYKMAIGTHGVWMSYRSSPLITLYHMTHHVRLLEIDYTDSLNLGTSGLPHDYQYQVNLDQRITYILPYGNFLWVGTGGGCICVFTVHPNGVNVASKLSKLVEKEREQDASFFDQSVVYQHGLIGVEDTATDDEEKQKTRYKQRRQFGRTFHTKFTSSGRRMDEDSDIYKLDFMASHNLSSEYAEAVRAMVPISYGSNPYMVTCCRVRKLNESAKSVQLWYCPEKQSPQKWEYQFIDCNAVVMRHQSKTISESSPTVKITKLSHNTATTEEHIEPLNEAS